MASLRKMTGATATKAEKKRALRSMTGATATKAEKKRAGKELSNPHPPSPQKLVDRMLFTRLGPKV